MVFVCCVLFVLAGLLSRADLSQLDGADAPVLRDSGGRAANPFRFLSLGIMAYLGNDKAGKLTRCCRHVLSG